MSTLSTISTISTLSSVPRGRVARGQRARVARVGAAAGEAPEGEPRLALPGGGLLHAAVVLRPGPLAVSGAAGDEVAHER